MIDTATKAFRENKLMIEAQQRIIDANPTRLPMPATADRAITLFQRLMKSQDSASHASA